MIKFNQNNNIVNDNIIYLLYFFIVTSVTIILYGGLDDFIEFYKINADNRAYNSIFLKINSYFKNETIDISNNIAIPGLGFLIFIFSKIFVSEFVYAYFILMFISYIFTLNILRILFNSSISFLSLIFGWEFIMTSTTGGTEPVISLFLFLSIFFYKKNKNNFSYFFILLGTLVKPFIISVYGAYFFHKLLEKKYYEIFKFIFFTILTVIIFFLLNYILYHDAYNIISMYHNEAWLQKDLSYNIPIIIFFDTMLNSTYKIDHTLKVIFYFSLCIIPIFIGIFKKQYLNKEINLYLFILICYFLIVFLYPSIWSYYEFVRFISPVVPILIYLLYSEFELIKKLTKNFYIMFFLLILSSIFYSFANFGIKNIFKILIT